MSKEEDMDCLKILKKSQELLGAIGSEELDILIQELDGVKNDPKGQRSLVTKKVTEMINDQLPIMPYISDKMLDGLLGILNIDQKIIIKKVAKLLPSIGKLAAVPLVAYDVNISALFLFGLLMKKDQIQHSKITTSFNRPTQSTPSFRKDKISINTKTYYELRLIIESTVLENEREELINMRNENHREVSSSLFQALLKKPQKQKLHHRESQCDAGDFHFDTPDNNHLLEGIYQAYISLEVSLDKQKDENIKKLIKTSSKTVLKKSLQKGDIRLLTLRHYKTNDTNLVLGEDL